jgi:3-oxoacyl-[acyl-carrier protein] reductase
MPDRGGRHRSVVKTVDLDELAATVARYPDLTGKVAFVTGGSRGIGAATCRALGANGMRVGVVGLDEHEDLARIVGEVRRLGGDGVGIAADLTESRQVARARGELEAAFGPADVVVAFAGGVTQLKPLHEVDEDDWRWIVRTNLESTYLTLKEFIPGMIERQAGSIVTMGSTAARFLDSLTTAPYAAAKAGVVMATRHTAHEVASHGIRVNCVCPGTTHSERVDAALSPEGVAAMIALTPLGRMGEPEDTANATLFLASDAASWITGASLDVNGGRVMM